MSQTLKPFLAKVANGEALTRAEAETAFAVMMSGEATPSQIGGFLMALRVRGETVDEIAGAVSVMRANMLPVVAPDGAVDIVGTGGDHAGTLNVSTCSAFVLAGCGVKVAKHGNRALSSKSGSADVLTALGVKVDLSPTEIAHTIETAGLGFMFAPSHHAAMRFVGPSRVELGTRTVFNLLGPLANPAGVGRLLVGVFSPDWVRPVAETLKALRTAHAWVVHGDGLDEMSVSGTTRVAALSGDEITEFEVTPEDAGLGRWPLEAIKGGNAEENAVALRRVLDGAEGGYRDIVLLNTAGALVMSGHAAHLKEGAVRAAESIASGRARSALETLIAVSQSGGST